jgi:glycosyltransferase involved in cell wall biosynthesis
MSFDLPYISVVIANLNQYDRLEMTLSAFQAQSYPAERIEILVVDNGSTDGSLELLINQGINVIEIDQPKNPYVCRNIGIRQAKHEWIALTDSSCMPNTEYLIELVDAQVKSEADLVVGEREFKYSDPPSLGEIVDSLHFMRNHEFAEVRKTYPTGTMLFHKSLVKEVGYFREDMRSGPDFLWTIKIHDADLRVVYAPKARVTYAATSFPSLFRKAYRDGRGHGMMAREQGTFNWITGIWRLRPPGPGYLRYVLSTRGKPEFKTKWLRIWFGLWAYRVVYNVGRLFPGNAR